jgi:two-component sensor histidine kinase
VLIVAPFRRDAAVLGDMLKAQGFDPRPCANPMALAEQLVGDTPPIVLSQEGLTNGVLETLKAHLEGQGQWSELPLIMLLDRDQRIGPTADRLRASLTRAKLTFLQRPVRAVELISAIQTAVGARNRQLQVRDHIIFQEELQRELNHRVKNALANVMAIYHLTKRQSENFDEFTESFEGRLAALSQVHSALVATNEPRELAEIAETVLAPYRSTEGRRVLVSGPRANLAPGSAVAFAMSLHELATNASKYGALSSADGSVEVSWRLERQGSELRAVVDWVESGGPKVVPPTRRGYGTAFIHSAARSSLRGSVDFDFAPSGLRCTFSILVDGPAEEDAPAEDHERVEPAEDCEF